MYIVQLYILKYIEIYIGGRFAVFAADTQRYTSTLTHKFFDATSPELISSKSSVNIHYIPPPELISSKSSVNIHYIPPPELISSKSNVNIHYIPLPELISSKSSVLYHHIRRCKVISP